MRRRESEISFEGWSLAEVGDRLEEVIQSRLDDSRRDEIDKAVRLNMAEFPDMSRDTIRALVVMKLGAYRGDFDPFEHTLVDQLMWMKAGMEGMDVSAAGPFVDGFLKKIPPFLTRIARGEFVITHKWDTYREFVGTIMNFEECFGGTGFAMPEEFWVEYPLDEGVFFREWFPE